MKFNIVSKIRNTPASSIAVAMTEILAFIVVAFMMMIPDPAQAQSGNVYGNGQVQVYSQAEEAVVMQVRIKAAEPTWQTRTAGAGIGAAVGGAIGSSAKNQHVGALVGAALGGIFGERAASAVMTSDAQEIVLQVFGPNGRPARVVTIVQPAPYDHLVSGERVYLSNTAGKWRVIKRSEGNVAFIR
ncbi:glycine zipper domain-containing protein [Hydrogenophaga sp. PML113]|uniref:glycine zipper domain-containing protein n=1 Tax=Hydrogenophaga sp. PML113 TaxID=1899350 RepID=UPI00087853C0|nr:glycine zipper domain-containing protein [Hydrogenophaga sp. PML113]